MPQKRSGTKKKIGVGATCSALTRFIHPRKDVCEKYPNVPSTNKTEGLIVLRKEIKKVNRREQECVVVRHEDFAIELHVVRRFCGVITEGPVSEFFSEGIQTKEQQPDVDGPAVDEGVEALTEVPASSGNIAEDVERFRADGFLVDDDNEPADENIPIIPPAATQEQETTTPGIDYNDWDSATTCHRKSAGHIEENPRLLRTPSSETRLGYFCLFLNEQYIQEVLLPMSSAAIDGKKVSYGEFMRYIGIWLLMSTQIKTSVREYFSAAPIDPYANGALFRCNEIMSANRFTDITRALTYTDVPAPAYKDKFHEIRQLVNGFNDHVKTIFQPGWVSCLDESISPWTSKWTCPGSCTYLESLTRKGMSTILSVVLFLE